MKRKRPVAHRDRGDLRRRAEERVAEKASCEEVRLTPDEVERLLHDLEVHRVELEVQNEELRAVRLETEAGLARYTELFDFAPIGYVTLSLDGVIGTANHTAAALLGKERGNLVGRGLAELVAARDLASLRDTLERAVHEGTKTSCELELSAKGQGPVQVHLSASALKRAEPTIMVALEDITGRKAWEQKLAQTERALREADRRKDEFLALLSHELRNPLAPIRSSVYLLARADPGSEKAKRAQVIIERQVSHLTRLIDDLLDVTRITRGKVQLHFERVELGDLVRRTMDDHRTSFDASGIRLEGRFDKGALWVNADPARLVQVVSNLLGNAEKFTPRGGNVAVSIERQPPLIVLRVRDDGAGIAAEVLEHLFEPFAQAPQTMDRSRGGLGLGLAMVKGLVEAHRGKVGISSEGPGRGTEVTMSLPLEPVAGEVEPPSGEQPELRRRRVLIIEDNRDAAESLGDALSLGGHEVKVAYDGPTGLEAARSWGPEIVVCDIGLPGMDGYAVARAFRREQALRGIHLVALSDYAQPEDLHQARVAGFDQHVAKPPSLEKLDRILAEAPAAPAAPASEASGPARES